MDRVLDKVDLLQPFLDISRLAFNQLLNERASIAIFIGFRCRFEDRQGVADAIWILEEELTDRLAHQQLDRPKEVYLFRIGLHAKQNEAIKLEWKHVVELRHHFPHHDIKIIGGEYVIDELVTDLGAANHIVSSVVAGTVIENLLYVEMQDVGAVFVLALVEGAVDEVDYKVLALNFIDGS